MSSQEKDRKVHPRRHELTDKVTAAHQLTKTVDDALTDLENCIDAHDLDGINDAFSAAMQTQDKLRQIVDTDIAWIIDAIAPRQGRDTQATEVSSPLQNASHDVMVACSLLWTVRNSRNYRDRDQGKDPGRTLDEFIKDLIHECQLTNDRLPKSEPLEVWSRWGS